MRKPFIAANWKMNLLVEDSVKYGEDIVEYLKRENVDLKEGRRCHMRALHTHGRAQGHIRAQKHNGRRAEYAL